MKLNNTMISIPIERRAEFQAFIDYCLEFYGEHGIYSMGASRDDIALATGMRVVLCDAMRMPFEGDSLDREAVRELLIERFGYVGG